MADTEDNQNYEESLAWVEFATQSQIAMMTRAILEDQRRSGNVAFFGRCARYCTSALLAFAEQPEVEKGICEQHGQSTQPESIPQGDSGAGNQAGEIP